MKILLLALATLSATAFAAPDSSTFTSTSTGTATETSTWKRVDKSLNDGVRTAKKKFMEDDGAKKPKPHKNAKDKNGHELENAADALNETWDSALHGVGKILKGQQTGTATSVSTATGTSSH